MEILKVFEQIEQIWNLTVFNTLGLILIIVIQIGIYLNMRDK